MNVLFVSAEVDPFAKVGGLADVIGSLPAALRRLGVDARVIMPNYNFISHEKFNIKPLISFPLERRTGTTQVELFVTHHDDVPIYFVRGWPHFGHSEETAVYSGYHYDGPRFIFFSQAVIAACDILREHTGFFPDVMHVNDWHTGLVPFLISLKRQTDPRWRGVGAVLGIHNMAYQGDHMGGWLFQEGIPMRNQPDLMVSGLSDNMLAMSIAYSDVITTVSPRYSTEIQYPYMGYGLEGLIRTRLGDLRGILNGIDVDLWNPATDPQLAVNFDAEDFREKRIENKRRLQEESNLPVRDDVPLIGLVTRLVWQKGIDLAFPAMRGLLATEDVQFVALGAGEPQYNEDLRQLGTDFPGKASAYVGYNAAIAQHIYGGCDLFLMPSHYEPCGVGQMLAMRYGALPLVRATGGLADTVANYDGADADEGTGFVFEWETADAVFGTLRWATQTFRENPDAWQRMQERAMRTDFSWKKSALEYIEVYENSVDRHQGI